jgi:diaminopimelate decarboxylase
VSLDIPGPSPSSSPVEQGTTLGFPRPNQSNITSRLSVPTRAVPLSDQDLKRTPQIREAMAAARAILDFSGFTDTMEQRENEVSRDALARTPILVFNRDILSTQALLWRTTMGGESGRDYVQPYFAIKSCSADEVIRNLQSHGFNFDAATDGEIEYLEKLGIPGSQVVRTRPICAEDDMRILQRYKPHALVVEDVAGIKLLHQAGIPNAEYAPTILVRIKFGLGNLQKFGCDCASTKERAPGDVTTNYDHRPALEILRFARAAEKANNVSFKALGLTAHVGTNTTDASIYGLLMGLYSELTAKILAVTTQKGSPLLLTEFDIGGGYPDQQAATKAGTTQRKVLEDIYRHVSRFTGEYEREHFRTPSIIGEPGRVMVADAAVSISRSSEVSVKNEFCMPHGVTVREPNIQVRLDEGVYGMAMGKIHDDKVYRPRPFRIFESSNPFFGPQIQCVTIYGPTCDSVDGLLKPNQLLEDTEKLYLPSNTRAGDFFLIPTLGAYSLVTATDFNQTRPSRSLFYSRVDGGYNCSVYDRSGRTLLGEFFAPDIAP